MEKPTNRTKEGCLKSHEGKNEEGGAGDHKLKQVASGAGIDILCSRNAGNGEDNCEQEARVQKPVVIA